MEYIIITIAIASFFYLIIPGLGAFYVRSKWRGFRKHIIFSSLFPILDYNQMFQTESEYAGDFRFFGEFQAIQSDNIIWLSDGSLSVKVDLEKVSVFVLPAFSSYKEEGNIERNEDILMDEIPKQIPWARIFSLPEGTKMLICGSLYLEKGHGIFKAGRKTPLTIVLYETNEKSILRRSIWTGRHRNEYWNQFTPGSLASGSLSLLIYSYMLLNIPLLRFQALISLSISLIPIIMFLPPGIILFYLYKSLWRKGRFFRAERDLLLLPLRYFNAIPNNKGTVILPDKSVYKVKEITNLTEELNNNTDCKMRTSVLMLNKNAEKKGYLYEALGESGKDKSTDPMVETLIIPEKPEMISDLCGRKARKTEFLAMFAFVTGFLINILIIFTVLSVIIK